MNEPVWLHDEITREASVELVGKVEGRFLVRKRDPVKYPKHYYITLCFRGKVGATAVSPSAETTCSRHSHSPLASRQVSHHLVKIDDPQGSMTVNKKELGIDASLKLYSLREAIDYMRVPRDDWPVVLTAHVERPGPLAQAQAEEQERIAAVTSGRSAGPFASDGERRVFTAHCCVQPGCRLSNGALSGATPLCRGRLQRTRPLASVDSVKRATVPLTCFRGCTRRVGRPS